MFFGELAQSELQQTAIQHQSRTATSPAGKAGKYRPSTLLQSLPPAHANSLQLEMRQGQHDDAKIPDIGLLAQLLT